MPPEKELARQIVAVIGAGNGIGKGVAHRLAREGAHIVCVDANESASKTTSDEINEAQGRGTGVAGTGISNCGVAIGTKADITKRETIRSMLAEAILAYGGLDAMVVTAGIFISPDESGHIEDEQWTLTYAINVIGAYLVADETAKISNGKTSRQTLC